MPLRLCVLWPVSLTNIGALRIKGLGVNKTISIIKNPQNPYSTYAGPYILWLAGRLPVHFYSVELYLLCLTRKSRCLRSGTLFRVPLLKPNSGKKVPLSLL